MRGNEPPDERRIHRPRLNWPFWINVYEMQRSQRTRAMNDARAKRTEALRRTAERDRRGGAAHHPRFGTAFAFGVVDAPWKSERSGSAD